MVPKTVVATGFRGQQVRAMAAFLFEYSLPGMRRPNFQPDRTPDGKDPKPPLLKQEIFSKYYKFFGRLKRFYNDPMFELYIQQLNGSPELEAKHPVLGNPCITFPELVSPHDIDFWELMPEYRCSSMIFDWAHFGNEAMRFGNYRRRRAALYWIAADDEARRECLLNVEKETTLNQFTKDALGQDYPMRIEKRLKRMMWQCEQPFKMDKKTFKRRETDRYVRLAFDIGKEEALYMLDLYDLPRRLPEYKID